LQCLTAAIRPLHVEELAEVLAVDIDAEGAVPKLNEGLRWKDQKGAVLSACSSLVAVVNVDGSDVVQFSHPSVKEFLTSPRLAASSERVSFFHVSLEPAHTILAQACLGVLLRLDDQINRDSIKEYPLAEYAARYWVEHANHGNVSSHLEVAMETLFDPEKRHFDAWVWMHDMTNPRIPLRNTQRDRRLDPCTIQYYVASIGWQNTLSLTVTWTLMHEVVDLGPHSKQRYIRATQV